MERMKCAIYVRTSIGKPSEALEEQIRILREYAISKEYEIYNIYADFSTYRNHLKFDMLMKDAEAKKFDVVLVHNANRFTTSMADLMYAIDRLDNVNVYFKSLNDDIENITGKGRLLLLRMKRTFIIERSLNFECVRMDGYGV